MNSWKNFKRFYLLIFRERGKEREREGEKHQCERETIINCLFNKPQPGPNLQPSHTPWQRIEPVNLCFVGGCPIEPHWSGQKFFTYWTGGIYVIGKIIPIFRNFGNCKIFQNDIYKSVPIQNEINVMQRMKYYKTSEWNSYFLRLFSMLKWMK